MRRSLDRLGSVCLVLGILAGVPAQAGAPATELADHDTRLAPHEIVERARERPADLPEALAPLAVCPTTALTSNGSTSGTGRAPSGRNRGNKGVYLITAAELAASGLLNGSSPSAIGWRYSTAPGVTASGTLTVYLQNTSDTTYSKGTSFAAAIAGMTTVHNAATTLPNTTAGFDLPFAGGSPFTYTGGGLYVAFDWQYPSGPLSATAIVACNTLLTSGLASITSTTSPAPDTLAASNFRPETRLTVTIGNDVSVDYVLALGQLPNGLVAPQVVGAVVTNRGNAQTDIPVTLNVTGAQTFTDTQTVAALAACGGRTTVAFAPFTPSALGNDTVTVSVPADDVPINDALSRNLENTVNRYSYKHSGTTAAGGVGVTGNAAEFVAKFSTNVVTQVDAVTVEFPASIPGATYKLSIREDAGGTPGLPAYVDAADRDVVAGSFTIRLPAPVAVGPGDFYVGVQQTSTVNMGLGFDQETPIRSGAFYLAVGAGPFSDFSPGNNFKLNIGITVGACLVPLSVNVTPESASICAGNPLVFTAAAAGGTGAIAYQWTENSGDLSGEISNSLNVTKAGAGTFNYNVKVTDDGGCIAVVDPSSSSGTWVGGGGPCDDGDPCTGPDTCAGPVCAGPNTCDDFDACTNDTCSGGGCSHTAVNCDDANPCTDDACTPASGCVNTNNALPCSDGSACTVGDTCTNSVCVPGSQLVCQDSNPCTDDSCSPASGCVFANNTNACDDANPCTQGDACGEGSCQSGALDDCADSDACTADSCDPTSGACLHIPTACDDGNDCTQDSCNPLVGCQYETLEGACDDHSACTTGDTCSDGVCVPGTPAVCVDGNGCTDDTCNPLTGGCEFSDNTAACDDGDPCTNGDACGSGSCQPGAPTVPPANAVLHASNKTTYTWPAVLFATRYDVVRGKLAALPAGPGAGDEICFPDLGSATFSDNGVPPAGTAYWYLVRGENGCFTGTYGTRSDGTPRLTTTCP